MSTTHFIALTFAAGLVATAAQAQSGTPGPAAKPSASPAAVDSARRVVRDKATGKLRAPTTEELEADSSERRARGEAEPNAKGAPLAVRQHANGMRSAVLGDDYMSTLQASRGADGKLVIRHANPAHEHKLDARRQSATTQ